MPLLPAIKRDELNEIAAGVIQHGDLGRGHVGRRHGELRPARLHPLVIRLPVVGEEHGRGLPVPEHLLPSGFRRRSPVGRQLQLRRGQIDQVRRVMGNR